MTIYIGKSCSKILLKGTKVTRICRFFVLKEGPLTPVAALCSETSKTSFLHSNSLVMSLLKQTKKFHIKAMRIMSERGPSSYHGWVHIPSDIRRLEEKESIHSVENITLLQNTVEVGIFTQIL